MISVSGYIFIQDAEDNIFLSPYKREEDITVDEFLSMANLVMQSVPNTTGYMFLVTEHKAVNS